jgi:hypothetical protein
MVGIRERRFGSWLDRASAIVLGTIAGIKLWERCKGKPGLFITLTYDRWPFADALDCYRVQSERQHVAMFIRRLSRKLGVSLKGQWTRKLEFQEDGWPHFHIVLMGHKFIENRLISECWGHGYTSTKGLTRDRCIYFTKYITKGNCALPSFILGEKPRSLKIFSSSPGFWGENGKESTYCPVYAKYGPPPPQRVPGFVPIGHRMEQCRGVTVAKCQSGGKPRGVYSVPCEPARFLGFMAQRSRRVVRADGWLWFDCAPGVEEQAAVATRRRPPEGGGGAPRSGAFNLSGTRKPDADCMVHLLPWLARWWEEQARATECRGVTYDV